MRRVVPLFLLISLVTMAPPVRAQTASQLATIQELLIWTGHLNNEVGLATPSEVVESIKAFQRSAGSTSPTGVLSKAEFDALRRRGTAARTAVGFETVFERTTGIQVGIPKTRVGAEIPDNNGIRWESADKELVMNVLSVPLAKQTLDQFYESMQRPPRKTIFKKKEPNYFVVEGELSATACFHVRAEEKDNQFRALSIVHKRQPGDEFCVTKYTPIVNAAASTFVPFPNVSRVVQAAAAVPPPTPPPAPTPTLPTPVGTPTPTPVPPTLTPPTTAAPSPLPPPRPTATVSADAARNELIKSQSAAIRSIARAPDPAPGGPAAASRWPRPFNPYEGRRRAFVVGVNNYANIRSLSRAEADAEAVSSALEGLEFKVTLLNKSPRRSDIVREWGKFVRTIGFGDTVAVFFAGHGVEIERQNYLLPSDIPNATAGEEQWIKDESISLSKIVNDAQKAGANVRLVILDACRDNPFAAAAGRSVGGSTRGLAAVEPARGEFFIYSASAGEQALDSLPTDPPTEKNSIFTRNLLRNIKTPAMPIDGLAKGLRRDVSQAAMAISHNQTPTHYDGMSEPYCLAGDCPIATQ